MTDLNKPLWQLTCAEFIDLQRQVIDNIQPAEKVDYTGDKYVYGLAGLAKLLGCSTRTASQIKASGKIDGAIIQEGRTIIIHAEKALQLLKAQK